MVTLAAQAALAANLAVIRTLRLVGATDAFIARAFVRRFTLRALAGAVAGTVLAVAALLALPAASAEGGFLTGLGFQRAGWLVVPAIPLVAMVVAFVATRVAAFRMLRGLT
jgi:cell division transport system permease protein